MEAILPPVQLKFTPQNKTLPADGEKRGLVLFFTGCIQEGLLSPVNQATINVLQRNGFEVLAPDGQMCCGAAHLHLGDKTGARELARQNIDAFLAHQNCCAIVTNTGGCGAILKDYHHLLSDDPAYQSLAVEFSKKMQDINEFLAENMICPPRGAINATITYSDSCHLRHGQKIVDQPRRLLRNIPGLKYIELSSPDRCCGSAGVYNLAQVDTANEILDAKVEDIVTSGVDIVATSNTGCHMQLLAGVRKMGLNIKVLHVVEVLDLSYRLETQE